jgi:nucleoside phosphorylase
MLTLFIPSNYEAAVFKRALENGRKVRVGGVVAREGRLCGVPVRLVVCGMGPVHSARRVEAVLAAVASSGALGPVWLAGFGGGLDPGLERYAIVYLAGDAAVASAIGRVPSTLPPRRIETILTSGVVVDTPEKKRAAFRDMGAPIVDMETGPFLALAGKYQCQWAVIRIVSDEVSEEFPADLIASSHDFVRGRDTPLRLAWRLLTHPRDVGRLRKFLAPLPEARRRLLAFVAAAARMSLQIS